VEFEEDIIFSNAVIKHLPVFKRTFTDFHADQKTID